MSIYDADASASSQDPKNNGLPPTELDRFVDHFLSIMCDHSRRQILELLANPAEEAAQSEHTSPLERRSGDIARMLGLSPGTVSGHLRQLASAGLVTSRREGNAIYYRLSNHMLVRAFHDLMVALNQEHAQRSGASNAT
jgi:DNA-binding transcriptional ArsR family regulator